MGRNNMLPFNDVYFVPLWLGQEYIYSTRSTAGLTLLVLCCLTPLLHYFPILVYPYLTHTLLCLLRQLELFCSCGISTCAQPTEIF